MPKAIGTNGVMKTSINAATASTTVIGIKYLTYLMKSCLTTTSRFSKYLLSRASDIEVPREADIIIAGSSKTPWGSIRSRL